ncbi:MAG: hypothetical protein HC853_02815 [Anaerolineae bacterium]|nr:hypothetical protein [Anaerolineae bacterium]
MIRSTFIAPHTTVWIRVLICVWVALCLGLAQAGRATAQGVGPLAGGLPSNIFDQNSVGWLSVRNMTSAQFSTYFAQKSDAATW